MKVYILVAHPNTGKSVNHAMTKAAEEHLKKNGHEVRVCDLYAEKFNCLPGKHDFKKIQNPEFFDYQAEQKWAIENDGFSDELKKQMDNVSWADVLLWQFPLWWWSYPTILKGWIDRVFAYHFVYGGGKTLKAGICMSITSGGHYEDFDKKFSFGNWGYFKFKLIKPLAIGGVFPFIDGKQEEELFKKRQEECSAKLIAHLDEHVLGEKITFVN